MGALWDARHKWTLAAEAGLLLAVIRIGVLIVPYAALRRAIDRVAPPRANPPSTADPVTLIVRMVRGIGRRMPGSTCLVEALAADTMLRRRAIESELRLGVRKPLKDARRVEGHAWIEHRGEVVLGMLDDLGDFEVMSAPIRNQTGGALAPDA